MPEQPRGPWSDLPPPARPPRQPIWRRPGRPREPIIANWRGLLIIGFLMLVLPFLANWAARVIMGMISAG
jgi:hypothetical protein